MPDMPYSLLRNPDGHFLNGDLTLSAHTGDDGMWTRQGPKLRSAIGDHCLLLSDERPDGLFELRNDQGTAIHNEALFALQSGPAQLPSRHLAELTTTGLTVLHGIMDADAISRFKQQAAENRLHKHPEETPHDGHFWMMQGLSWSVEVARACTHPVALWLLQEYISTKDIHFCHQPVITTLKPARELLGTFPEGGWHSDYPYHPGVFADEIWPDNPVFGAQYNVCIDSFETGNAGTQYVPGSHLRCKPPPLEFNLGGTQMGEGQHKDVRQLLAPAGAALIYDARTWHRACHELNESGKDRIALLNAVAPAWVLPMLDKGPVGASYLASDIPALLSQRQRDDVNRLCNSPPMVAPNDMPVLSERTSQRLPRTWRKP